MRTSSVDYDLLMLAENVENYLFDGFSYMDLVVIQKRDAIQKDLNTLVR